MKSVMFGPANTYTTQKIKSFRPAVSLISLKSLFIVLSKLSLETNMEAAKNAVKSATARDSQFSQGDPNTRQVIS